MKLLLAMIKRYVFAWLVLCTYMYSCSVSEKRSTALVDTIDVDSLTEQYSDSILMNPASMIDFFLGIREKTTDSISSNKLLLNIANCHYYLNQADTAMALYDQILDFCERETTSAKRDTLKENRINLLKASIYKCLGTIFFESGLPDSALIYFNKSFNAFPTVPVYVNIAEMYHHKGDFPLASQYYRKAFLMVDSLQNGEKYNFSIFSAMSKLYQDLDNFVLAEQYYEKAAQYTDHINISDNVYFENTRGNFYYLTKDYEKALGCFNKADRLAATISHSFYQAIAKTNLGEVYLLIDRPDSARIYLNQAKELFGPLFYTPQFNFYLTGLYAALALKEDNLPEAEKLLLQPYDTLSVNPQYIYFHNKRMEEYYLRKQDYKKAYFYRSEAEMYNDSIRNVKVRNNIAEIDARYSQDTTLLRKDIQIALAENGAIQWKYSSIASIALFVLTLLTGTGLILYRRKINKLRQAKQHSTIVSLRMENIRNRLSPHFMFNALNVIMPSLGKYKELENPFRTLIQLLRDNLIASEQTAVSLKQEIEQVNNFLQFQTLKQIGSLQTDWLIQPDVSTDTLIPSMSIQIPVENAIKYAFPPDRADARLQIMIKSEPDAISITIEDNGIGYHPDKNQTDRKKGTGSGLNMLRRTIELLNTNNIQKITFTIENRHTDATSAKGTRVFMLIPIQYNYKI